MAAGLKGVPYNSIAFRICNNLLSNLKGLEAAIEYTLDDPSAMQVGCVAWCDCSVGVFIVVCICVSGFSNNTSTRSTTPAQCRYFEELVTIL